MKIGLVELKINEGNYYKYKSFKYCCTKIRDNPCIVFTGEDIVEESDDPSIWNIPKFCIRKEVTQDFWEDTFEYTNNFPINFCPFCGEKIEISIAEKKDISDVYNRLEGKRKSIRERIMKTDSKSRDIKLNGKARIIDRKIGELCSLSEYREVDSL